MFLHITVALPHQRVHQFVQQLHRQSLAQQQRQRQPVVFRQIAFHPPRQWRFAQLQVHQQRAVVSPFKAGDSEAALGKVNTADNGFGVVAGQQRLAVVGQHLVGVGGHQRQVVVVAEGGAGLA